MSSNKDLPLEALRGLAAVTVLFWHSMLGFYPAASGVLPGPWSPQAALNGEPWFGLIHGSAAVTLFFVLSGFVLTRRFLLTGEQEIILRGAVKRWPRLAGPVLMTVLFSWLLFRLGAYRYTQASAITHSPWLQQFGYSSTVAFEVKLGDALRQGLYLTFFRGDAFYDSSLWTMRYEFIGSFVAFGLALLTALIPREKGWLRLIILGIALFLCRGASVLYAAFPAGVALAAFLPERRFRLPGLAVFGLILLGVYLLGYTGGRTGSYVPVFLVFRRMSAVDAHIVASLILIVTLELAPDGFRRYLSGRFAYLLGAFSFPLYLVHVLIICSLGSAALVLAASFAHGPDPRIVGYAVAVAGSFVAAVPLVFFNERWVKLVGGMANRLLAPSVPLVAVRAEAPQQAVEAAAADVATAG